jgi:hypothetical protein
MRASLIPACVQRMSPNDGRGSALHNNVAM